VRQRYFFRLLLSLAVVIAATTATADFFVRGVVAEETVSALRGKLFLAAGVGFLVAVVVAAAGALTVKRRLQRIEEFAARLAEGDLGARIGDPAGDEIGHVAGVLDGAARRMETSFAELQTSQHQLETLLNSMQDAVIAVDAAETVQWANRSMERLTPRIRLRAPLVETLRDPDVLRTVQEAAETRAVCSGRAIAIVSGKAFDVTAAPMPGGGAVAVLRDLTERERLEKTRRDFIANVSHELRTPLTSIQGYAETLLDTEQSNGQVREFLEIIRKNASRMSRLTEDLLTLARVESGEQRFYIQPVAPAELLREAEESFHELAAGRSLQLEVHTEMTETVAADREAIHHVFGNLLDNAIKYGGTGGKLTLGVRRAGEFAEFYVQDFGQGISSEHLPRLFERFYRVDKARSRESGGTGLGLAIAKHIVLAHGGTIRAESELTRGSTFLFRLPLAENQQTSEVDPKEEMA
jgi:two-component system phosphate regulon sensor histidine kinase PhoR